MVGYYKRRIKTHYIITPIILIFYIVGFVILLPFFRESLSSGFYTYIKVSAIVLLFGLGFLIKKQVQKELNILKEISR